MALFLTAAALCGYSLWSPTMSPQLQPQRTRHTQMKQTLGLGGMMSEVVIYDLQMEEMMAEQNRKLKDLDSKLAEAEMDAVAESERAMRAAREAAAAAHEAQREVLEVTAQLDARSMEIEQKQALLDEAAAAAHEAQREVLEVTAQLDAKSKDIEEQQAHVEELIDRLGAEKAAFQKEMDGEKARRRRLQELIAELKHGLQSEQATGAKFKQALEQIAKVMETAEAD